MTQASGTDATREIIKGYPSTMGDDVQLNTTTIIRHAARTHGDQRIVYRAPDGGWDEYTYADCYARVKRMANALRGLGVKPADRVGVIDWNNKRHFELYWAVPALGACMVQMNLRLGEADLGYVAQNCDATVICVDESLLSVAEKIAPVAEHVKAWVVMTDKPMSEVSTTLPNAVSYEEILAAADPEIDFPEIDETSAYGACYTTGTTGRPKGVYYSHRAIVLHAYAIAMTLGITLDDCAMYLTPMFHVSAWGIPQASALVGIKIVLPGRFTADDAKLLTDIMVEEKVSVINGAPSVFLPMLRHIESLDTKPDFTGARLISGGSEPPLSMMRAFQEMTGAEVVHAYGSTETTPIVTMNRYKSTVKASMTPEQLLDLKRKQGLVVNGVDIRLLDPIGNELPHDGESQGEIQLRGPWVTTAYHGMSAEETADRFEDGWWRSGDVGTLDQDGYLKITDRLKDVIKSGGEWISSIDMENMLTSHPKIASAAVVGLEHPKWQERPYALIVTKPGQEITLEEIHEHLKPNFAHWQMPEDFDLVVEIPQTSVGKFDKKRIRAMYSGKYTGEGTTQG